MKREEEGEGRGGGGVRRNCCDLGEGGGREVAGTRW